MHMGVFLETRISTGSNLKVAKFKPHRFAAIPTEGVADDVPPGRPRPRFSTGLIDTWSDPVPTERVGLEATVRRPRDGSPFLGQIAATDFWVLAQGRITTFNASVASQTNRYPSIAVSKEYRCVTSWSTGRPSWSQRNAFRVSGGPAE